MSLRYAFRMLVKTPGVTAIALVTLAVGIGANTAVFSIIDGVLLRDLPYPQPDRLVGIRERSPEFDSMSVSYPNFLDWRAQQTTFTALAAFRDTGFSLTGLDEPELLRGAMVSATWFELLGVRPALGRAFTAADDRVGAPPVAVIGQALWKRRFGGEPSVIGATATLDGTKRTIVGVLPAGVRFYGAIDVLTPIGQWDDIMPRTRDMHPGITAIGRLKPGVSLDRARADLSAIANRLALAYPASNKGHGITVRPLKDELVRGGVRTTLWVLLAAVAFVLLIACVNVANLLLARSTARQREIAIRTALGAGRRTIIAQFMTESVLLALAGGALGILVAVWVTGAAVQAVPEGLPRMEEIRLNGTVLAFALAASILTGLLFGILPALRAAGSDPAAAMKESGRGVVRGRQRLRDALVVAEVALAMVLLAGAGLMIRTMWRLANVNPGFDTQRLLTFQVSLSPAATRTAADARNALRRLERAIQTTPGVQAAAATDLLPMDGSDSEAPFWIEGRPRPSSQGEMNWALIYLTTPGYHRSMRIPLLRGRYFSERDDEKAPAVALIDEELARALFRNEDPIGRRMLIPFGPAVFPLQIVGVVGHVKHWGLAADDANRIRQQFYLPALQVPDELANALRGLTFVARTAGPPGSVLEALRAQVLREGPDQPVHTVRTMEEIVKASEAQRRFLLLLLASFAGTALLLACVGIYGVVAYAVSQRTHEIGIRMALGAARSEVVRMVVVRSAALAGAGVAVGAVGAAAATQGMRTLLFGVGTYDPLTYLVVAAMLGAVAVLASALPARRAARVDPLAALRYE